MHHRKVFLTYSDLLYYNSTNCESVTIIIIVYSVVSVVGVGGRGTEEVLLGHVD